MKLSALGHLPHGFEVNVVFEHIACTSSNLPSKTCTVWQICRKTSRQYFACVKNKRTLKKDD